VTWSMQTPAVPDTGAISSTPRRDYDTGPVLLLGYDRTQASQAALLVAVDLAVRLHSAHLHVVHAVNLLDYPIDPDADWEEQGSATLKAERVHVGALLVNFHVPWTYHLRRHTDPIHVLNSLADDTDAFMVIIGGRGKGISAAVRRLSQPAVAEGLMRSGHRALLVVPGPRKSVDRSDEI
jgi:nucleotide-binding universal stress UspA family protein